MRYKKISLRTIIILIAAMSVLIAIFRGFVALDEDDGTEPKISKEYLSIFSPDVQLKLTRGFSYKSKKRSPVTVTGYGGYMITMYKVETSAQFDLKKIQLVKDGSISDGWSPYIVIKTGGFFDIHASNGEQSPAGKIDIHFKGELIKQITDNDTFVAYSLMSEGFGIRLGNSGDTYLYARQEGLIPKVPVAISFVKKQSDVYLLLVSVNDLKYPLDLDSVRALVN